MKAFPASGALLAAIPMSGPALAAIPAAAATGPHAASQTVHISAKLTVTHTAPPVCTAGVCVIHNHGTGTLTPTARSPSPPLSPPTATSRPAGRPPSG